MPNVRSRGYIALLIIVPVLLAVFGATGPVAAETTFTVNRIGDASDLNLANSACDTSTNSGKQCTLRAAIEEANDTPGADTINFNITSTSKVIAPGSPLPPITDQLTIDGYTQTGASPNTQAVGNNAVLKIVLDGVNAGEEAIGLDLAGYRVTVKGLVIQRFEGTGVALSGTKSDVVGNRIGTNAAGTLARGNGVGLLVTGDQNTIGGTAPAARNLFSGNSRHGIRISGADAVGNEVLGNYVGTTATGNAALGNGEWGMTVGGGASLNRVGGTTAGSRNLFSANGNDGIALLGGDSNEVSGNLIGTKADGSGDLGNTDNGIMVAGSSDNLIGGTRSAAANVVSGNGGTGIDLYGTASFDNVARGNVVRANDGDGISVSSRRAVVAGNVIFGNALAGIEVFAFSSASANRNRISGNQIFGNGKLGIDLIGGTENAAGVTSNDTDDADNGPNDLQNFPLLTSAVRSGTTNVTTVVGSLNSNPSTQFTIELFIVLAVDASGHGEGQVLYASQNVTTNSGGDAGFAFQVGGLSPGTVLTATATSTSAGNTSEFAANRTVVPGP
ncbi:MAG TPA: right-handed parallel beta-helix repeat-containing protein [Candidatus Limnocylindrales bacterium]|nr:right-handed parallel beta-helix repeat-containing protein [Candidatus Limnocylindrales bacterium]